MTHMPLRRASTQQHALAPQLAPKPKPTKKETKTKQKKTSNWEGGVIHITQSISQQTQKQQGQVQSRKQKEKKKRASQRLLPPTNVQEQTRRARTGIAKRRERDS